MKFSSGLIDLHSPDMKWVCTRAGLYIREARRLIGMAEGDDHDPFVEEGERSPLMDWFNVFLLFRFEANTSRGVL